MKYTITRALAELTTLKDKHQKEVNKMNLIAVKQGAKIRKPNSSYSEKSFIEQANQSYQSVLDIERRILSIKNQIDASNFITKVKIGDTEMTVQEALNMKRLIELKQNRLYYLKTMKQKAQMDFDAGNEENRRRIEKMSQDQMSNGSSKAGDAEKEIVESVEKIYKMDFIDPVNLSDEIEKLENEIAEFNNNIDYVLSESNSTTYIEVE
jgi:hypothetical protein